MRLLLIRHGQTSSNVLGLLDTDAPGPSLTELGDRQSKGIPDALAERNPEAIFISRLVRTHETAVPLAEHLNLSGTVLGGLNEIEAGSLEDLSDIASVHTYLTTAFAWAEGDMARRMPGGPDGHEFFSRFDAAIADVVATGVETAAVFSHGMAIRAWAAARASDIDGSYAATHELDNTGMVSLDSGEDGTWTLVEWRSTPLMGTAVADAEALDPTARTLSTLREPTEPTAP
ncbi:histidine phosphatase family protein [Rathayibacter sp. YIM 133350]|uniref:histidine phosphatase family protein n=1 Tax=Rathayibacter sp. YIM 133350 TaxID=3131992 RepID=UPI00307DBEB8